MVQPKIEIQGLAEFNRFLQTQVPDEVRPLVIRGIARKPALKAVQEARRLQPIGDTGVTARTIGILKVRDQKQTWVEVGYKGRSLGHIFTTPKKQIQWVVRQKRGRIKTFMWLFQRAGDNIQGIAMRDMKNDITNVLVRAFKRSGFAR
jgi:hypothetical protein